MIIGVGVDSIDITRIRDLVKGRGQRFLDRVFSPTEQEIAQKREDPIPTFAKRFAAKEAFVKAIQTNQDGISWLDMEVQNISGGAPILQISGQALITLQAKIPENHTPYIHLSLTDTDTTATAMVVIEARPIR